VACHDAEHMGEFHLADGSPISSFDSSQLCGQCHEGRYQAWREGTHGIAGLVAGVKCIGCHDPHQPQVALTDITKPHPPAQPPPAPPSDELLVMFAAVSVLAVAVILALVRRGQQA
jgi:hypothetical protein